MEGDEYMDYRDSSKKKERFNMGGCWSQLFGLWVPRLEKILLDEHSKFDVPKAFNLMNMTEAFRKTFEKLKKVELAVHMFTLDHSFLSYVLVCLSKFCEAAAISTLYFIIRLYSADLSRSEHLDRKRLLVFLAVGVCFEVLRFALKHYAAFRSQKLGIILVSSLNYLVKTDLFKKNLETNYAMTELDYQTLLDKSTLAFESYPTYHLFIIEFTIHFILTTLLGFYIFGLNFFGGFFLLLVGFLLASSLFSSSAKRLTARYNKAKQTRIETVLNTIKSKLYIKARAWEVLFFNRIQRVRKHELDRKDDLERVMILQGWVLWTISFLSLVLILIVWVNSSSAAIYYYFIIFSRLYLEYYFLFREILAHRRLNDDRKQCLSAVNAFLQHKEIKPIAEKEDAQVKNYYSVFLQSAYFSWNDVNSIKLKKAQEPAHFGRYLKDNPNETIFEDDEEEDEDPMDEEALDQLIEHHHRGQGTKTRNSFLENSVAYTLKSETNYRKVNYEPNQVAGHDLTNLSMKIKKGNVVFIYGGPDSGKTSIFKAMMGEMLLDERFKAKVGMAQQVFIRGNVHFMPTEPWLIDGTLKENILMNKQYNDAKFAEALKLSFLEKDVDLLDSGIQTKLTDSYITEDPLFKLKIECARAIYSE